MPNYSLGAVSRANQVREELKLNKSKTSRVIGNVCQFLA